MPASPIDVYAAAFAERVGRFEVDEPGVRGVRAPRLRLLVTDDRAYGTLDALLGDGAPGLVTVFAAAERCTARIAAEPGWAAKPLAAMVCPDLDALPDPPLPAGLALRPIRRLAADPPGGVSLEDAVALVRLANPAVGGLADHLRSLPPAFRLLAAVDGDGVVRATSGAGAFGSAARVLLVDTHPAWRGRGIATAMTAAALHAARDAGARVACLDASDAGRSIYARLGFEVAGATTQFYRG